MADQNFNVNCGFFDSVNSDRLYSADQMNMPYKKLVGNGVFGAQDGGESNDLKVSASSGMTISVAAGSGIFGDKWFESASAISITVPANSSQYSRIDSVLAQVDKTTGGRVGRIVYRTGTAAAEPSAPAINTVTNVKEYRIANITVASGATSIGSGAISDLRGTGSCPWVKSILAPTTAYLETLFADKETETIVDNMNIGGRNLMLNTYYPDVMNLPSILGQSGNTAVPSSSTVTTATHGIRDTSLTATYPTIRFGANSGSMNGLVAGKTYTLSFDCVFKLYSGDTGSDTERAFVIRCITDTTGTMAITTTHVIYRLSQAEKGTDISQRAEFTFTVPNNATQMYLSIIPNSSTSSLFASGDYIEVSNIMLQEGNTSTEWSPAPEDVQSSTRISGRNLIINTYIPDVSAAAKYPRILGQASNTEIKGTASVATHGIRSTVQDANFPRIKFGASGDMNGLIAGQTYCISFDAAYKLFSGETSNTSTRSVVVCLYTDESGSSDVTASFIFANIPQSDKGVEKTAHCKWTFTVPSDISSAYLYIRPAPTTPSLYSAGDYLEMSNIMLQEGNVAAAWSPAPEDIAVQNVYSAGVQTVDGAKITNASITSDKLSSSIVSTLIYSGTTLLGGGSINHDFSGYKKLKIYYRMPSAQGSLELDLTVSGDTTIGQQSGYDPHYTSAFIPTADNVGGYVVMVSVNTGLTKLTVQEMGYRAFDAMSTYVDRAGNSSYYITKIYGFAEVEVV